MKNPSRTRKPVPTAIAIWSFENFILQTEFNPENQGEQVTSVSETARTSGHRSDLPKRKLTSSKQAPDQGWQEPRGSGPALSEVEWGPRPACMIFRMHDIPK